MLFSLFPQEHNVRAGDINTYKYKVCQVLGLERFLTHGLDILISMSIENLNMRRVESPETTEAHMLKTQIALPQSEWSNEFKRKVEGKIADKVANHESTHEEPTFDRYLRALNLDKDELKGKRIIDLGCGDAEFVKTCIEEGITNDVYGIDITLPDTSDAGLEKHLIKASFKDPISIKDANYIVSVGSLSNYVWGGEDPDNIKDICLTIMNSLDKDGEFRIWPIQQVAPDSGLEGIKESHTKWTQVCKDLEQEGVTVELRPENIVISGNNNEVVLYNTLILKRS